MLLDAVAALVEAADPVLAGRVLRAADLSELVRSNRLPAAPVAAFVLPLGLSPRGEGEAMTGAFVQAFDETVGVLIAVRASGDATGGKALPAVDALVAAAIAAVAGRSPGDEPGALRLARGALLSAEAGLVLYQLDFTLTRQMRILT